MDEVEEYSIDRFEGDLVILENRDTGDIKNVLIEQIPREAQEGDILKYIDGEFFLDKEKTEEVNEEIQEKYKNLWE